MEIKRNQVYESDCMEILNALPDGKSSRGGKT